MTRAGVVLLCARVLGGYGGTFEDMVAPDTVRDTARAKREERFDGVRWVCMGGPAGDISFVYS